MAVNLNLKKHELLEVAEEMGLTIPEKAKKIDLVELIENSEVYKGKKEFVRNLVEEVLEGRRAEKERTDRELSGKLELEKLRVLQLEKEIELAKTRLDLPQAIPIEEIKESGDRLEGLIRSIRTLTIPLPSKVESINLFFNSLEKAFKIKNVPEEYKSEILINLMGEKLRNLLIYIEEEHMDNYDKIKALILKEFQPTPLECLNQFKKARKLTSENYMQFVSRISAMFDYYCNIRKVSTFKELCELIVSDQVLASVDSDLQKYFTIKQGESWFKPQQLGKELDIYTNSNIRPQERVLKTNSENLGFRGQRNQNYQFNKKVFVSELKGNGCSYCKLENHEVVNCKKFKELSIPDRVSFVKEHSLCFKCLYQNCKAQNCRGRNCEICKRPHNLLLHFVRVPYKDRNGRPGGSENSVLRVDAHAFVPKGQRDSCDMGSSGNTLQALSATSSVENKMVLLSTAKCLIRDGYGRLQECRCILDVGSMANLITRACAERLNLKGEKTNVLVTCLGDSSMPIKTSVNAEIRSFDASFSKELNMLVVGKITEFSPMKYFKPSQQIPEHINLADAYNVPQKVDILLSAEVFYQLLRPGQICIPESNLFLQNSVFGYIVSGSVSDSNRNEVHCGLIREDELNSNIKKFWEVESVEGELYPKEEGRIAEEHYKTNTYRDSSGRYIVKIPLNENPECLGESKEIALKQLNSLGKRLARDGDYFELYRAFMREYEALGHMRDVTGEEEPPVTYYLPHHGVYKPEKTTTPLRVVFNASSKTRTGKSLNSLQYNGGVIQEDLFSIMTRFRKNTFAFTADIEKMYRMIGINPQQTCLQRIVWREREHEPVRVFELSTVTYGTVSAPFLALRTLKQLSLDEAEKYPLAAPVLARDFYMDDVLTGAETLSEAKELQKQLTSILLTAGMRLHKWCGNSAELTPNGESSYSFDPPAETKTLGVSWRPLQDSFFFAVLIPEGNNCSKREVVHNCPALRSFGFAGCNDC